MVSEWRESHQSSSLQAETSFLAEARSWVRKSVTIHATPAIAKVSVVSVQLDNLCGSEKRIGSHTSTPNPTSIAVSSPDARSADRPVTSATAASAKQIVVAIAQNIGPGGIHFGTSPVVGER